MRVISHIPKDISSLKFDSNLHFFFLILVLISIHTQILTLSWTFEFQLMCV